MKFGRVPHGLEIIRQAAVFENRTGYRGFVKALLRLDMSYKLDMSEAEID